MDLEKDLENILEFQNLLPLVLELLTPLKKELSLNMNILVTLPLNL